jgi:hypothetical protein
MKIWNFNKGIIYWSFFWKKCPTKITIKNKSMTERKEFQSIKIIEFHTIRLNFTWIAKRIGTKAQDFWIEYQDLKKEKSLICSL